MIMSMTGYGDASAQDADTAYVVELRSLNNRYFKATVKLPECMQYLEPEVEKMLRTRLRRGSISYVLRVRGEAEGTAYEVSTKALTSYVNQLRAVAGADQEGRLRVDLAALLTVPGVCQPRVPDEQTRGRWLKLLRDLTARAIDQVIQMRAEEGRALRDDLLGHCESVERHAAAVAELAPAVVAQYRDRLKGRVEALLQQQDIQLDADVLTREVVVFAERSDISEELARLTSHLKQFRDALAAGQGVGKKLEFISQEMLREANTIASKANDSRIAMHTVEIKSAIDRIKEQVHNVE